ncbi:hypothetical protein GPALN_013217 [Globodera pallida]|nr:hypothetical protein GPALN_013217 [Globodera pallida]
MLFFLQFWVMYFRFKIYLAMPKANSSLERMQHLLDTGHRADVHFLVREGDESPSRCPITFRKVTFIFVPFPNNSSMLRLIFQLILLPLPIIHSSSSFFFFLIRDDPSSDLPFYSSSSSEHFTLFLFILFLLIRDNPSSDHPVYSSSSSVLPIPILCTVPIHPHNLQNVYFLIRRPIA